MHLDAAQSGIAKKLEALNEALALPRPGLFARLFTRGGEPVHGLYIWGNVGRGKTMLMDDFFAQAPELPKRRVHFHGFMQEVHAARTASKSDDVIADIADGITKDAKLLCLDEMQVTDIADAMILGRLFEALWARGVVIVTTSNQPPDGLYKDGLNRQLFLPFVARLNEMMDVVELGAGKDYRLGRVAAEQTYISPLTPKADETLVHLWHRLADSETGRPQEIEVLGRKLLVPYAAHGCCWFEFDALCRQPLAAPDYLAIAKHYGTVFVAHVPVLKVAERNEAKRFILLIDTLYDAGTRLVVTAAAAPEKLCITGPHKTEFLRTASRLREMQSVSWWARD
ncbi:cell division protein ZapE [Aestuariivirga litoralis]|nr:cell division protein ZapE [Aestuariivirga litoralis]